MIVLQDTLAGREFNDFIQHGRVTNIDTSLSITLLRRVTPQFPHDSPAMQTTSPQIS